MRSSRFTYMSVQGLFGLLVLLFGLALLLDNMDVMEAGEILRYWPVVLILFGAAKMVEAGGASGRLFGGILALIGLLFLLANLDLIDFRLWDLWPLVIVLIGASMIWQVVRGPSTSSAPGEHDSYFSGSALMGGWKRSVSSAALKGGQLSAIMGGCELDLRDSSIEGADATLEVFAFWGGIELHVPADWRVVNNVTPIMGGVEDKTRPPQGPTAKRLVVRGTVIMGGVEIKN